MHEWGEKEANEPGKERRESALSYNICPLSVNHGRIFPLGMCPIGAQAFFTEEDLVPHQSTSLST